MANTVTSRDAPYKVAYEEGVRALSQQQSLIDSIRTRGGLLLSTGAVTTSFLGAQALNGGGPDVATWLALACFVGVSSAALAVLWPHRWEFAANPENVIESYIETVEPSSVAEMHRDLSIHMHGSYAENLAGQKQLATRFRLAGAFLTMEVILWICDLALKG